MNEPKQFGEMSELDQMCLFQAWLRGTEIEAYVTSVDEWRVLSHPNWGRGATYRIKPVELTKPSIDWSHVHADYKWMATDIDGGTYLFDSKPTLRPFAWGNNKVVPSVKAMVSFKAGTCNWKDSLVERPDE